MKFFIEGKKDLKNIQTISIVSLLIALNIVISSFFIPVGENLRIYFTFFINALAGLIGGPFMSIIYGFAIDTIGFIIHPSGAYFPGYALTSILGAFIYAIFLYKTKITITKLALSKLCVNLFCNIIINSIWSYLLYSKGYIYYFTKSLLKNIALLPFEIILLVIFIKLLLPTLNKLKITNQKEIPFI